MAADAAGGNWERSASAGRLSVSGRLATEFVYQATPVSLLAKQAGTKNIQDQ